ncbi:hypothetical protein CA85_11710 [Allorhodopirellula solitaria]|uniref:Uncharacterized protein n=1 Tax=Allorhodopirellula solitaria TaxID=2527987 RepID=A0A5C5YGL0_9BACT|nr:hypothetical protein CA85_11710 [Allorhodopirellula solitaria]
MPQKTFRCALRTLPSDEPTSWCPAVRCFVQYGTYYSRVPYEWSAARRIALSDACHTKSNVLKKKNG